MNEQMETKVVEYLAKTVGIAFDGCHKIYMLGDYEQVRLMIEYGYDIVQPSFQQLYTWYEDSCSLRFIEYVSTENGFEDVIAQFEDVENVNV